VGEALDTAATPANLLGNAGIPRELWGLVFGGAFLAWGLAEALSRLAWRHHMHDQEH
jgi:hypothetical protein